MNLFLLGFLVGLGVLLGLRPLKGKESITTPLLSASSTDSVDSFFLVIQNPLINAFCYYAYKTIITQSVKVVVRSYSALCQVFVRI